MGRYRLPIRDMNFLYDVPQECGTRTENRFVSVKGGDKTLTVIGAEFFDFSCHDFTLEDLIAARHRNELMRSEEKYLYIDYKMRGIGSHSCGPNPEACSELPPHSFRFVFGITGTSDEETILKLARSAFPSHTEKLSDTYVFNREEAVAGVLECNINRD